MIGAYYIHPYQPGWHDDRGPRESSEEDGSAGNVACRGKETGSSAEE